MARTQRWHKHTASATSAPAALPPATVADIRAGSAEAQALSHALAAFANALEARDAVAVGATLAVAGPSAIRLGVLLAGLQTALTSASQQWTEKEGAEPLWK